MNLILVTVILVALVALYTHVTCRNQSVHQARLARDLERRYNDARPNDRGV